MVKSAWLSVALVLGQLSLPAPAWAYLDPGAGGLIVQLILGGLAGLLVILRLYWRRLCAKITLLVRAVRNRH